MFHVRITEKQADRTTVNYGRTAGGSDTQKIPGTIYVQTIIVLLLNK